MRAVLEFADFLTPILTTCSKLKYLAILNHSRSDYWNHSRSGYWGSSSSEAQRRSAFIHLQLKKVFAEERISQVKNLNLEVLEIELEHIMKQPRNDIDEAQGYHNENEQLQESKTSVDDDASQASKSLTTMFCQIPHIIIWTDLVSENGLQTSSTNSKVLEAFASMHTVNNFVVSNFCAEGTTCQKITWKILKRGAGRGYTISDVAEFDKTRDREALKSFAGEYLKKWGKIIAHVLRSAMTKTNL